MIYTVIFILCMLFLYFCLKNSKDKNRPLIILFKGLASACFVTCGALTRNQVGSDCFTDFILLGLILGMVGDVFLEFHSENKTVNLLYFVVGTLSFMSGHIMYILSMVSMVTNPLLCIICGAVLGIIIFLFINKHITASAGLKVMGIIYIGVICTMVAFAVSSVVLTGKHWLLIPGALFFTISDVILILRNFGNNPTFRKSVVLNLLYYVAQMLIALSLLQL